MSSEGTYDSGFSYDSPLPYDVVVGSSFSLLSDFAEYFRAYDSLEGDRVAQQRLYHAFLLAHGGRRVEDGPFTKIVGGLHPVRVE